MLVRAIHQLYTIASCTIACPAESSAYPLNAADPYTAHLDAVLAGHGHLSATELRHVSYETEPMIEARANRERGGFLDLGESKPLPDITGAVDLLRRQLTDLETRADENEAAPAGCDEDLLEPLKSAREEANRILLAE